MNILKVRNLKVNCSELTVVRRGATLAKRNGPEPPLAPTRPPPISQTRAPTITHPPPRMTDGDGAAERASTPMFLMARKIKALGVKMVLSGEGALVHAYWGRAVVETRLVPWWRRRAVAASMRAILPCRHARCEARTRWPDR